MLDFDDAFKKVTGNPPYPWQARLYKLFLKGEFPESLNIPTGLGKTSVMTIWRLALAESANVHIPTRLVYMVDRRSIVDQASDEARKLHDALVSEKICGKEDRLNISTLRGGGGMADGREWLMQPDVPAVVIGTIDMIGSRLLFSGYGVGNKTRPFYAGMLGQDSLIVLDETHLSPAMEETLRDAQRIAESAEYKLFPPRMMFMSATQRSGRSRGSFSLEREDLEDPKIVERYKTKKHLRVVESDDVVQRITDEALKLQGRILIYLQRPSDVQKVSSRIKKLKERVVALTGTMRGFERDQLAAKDEYCRFKTSNGSTKGSEKRYFLVSTSAGEVGVDLDADHMVCDLTTFDSMVQRLGRVNRSGGRESSVTAVYSKSRMGRGEMRKRLAKTLDILREIADSKTPSVSPDRLDNLPVDVKIGEAYSPSPATQPLTENVLGMWSMTSLPKYPSRPSVSYWLRGKSEVQIPETHVVWRSDVKNMVRLEPGEILEILDSYRVLPHELARDSTSNVCALLKKMGSMEAIILSDNTCKIKNVSDIASRDVEYATLLLPCDAGGLGSEGMLESSKQAVSDVADEEKYVARARLVVEVDENEEYRIRTPDKDSAQNASCRLEDWLKGHPRMKLVHSADLPKSNVDEQPDELRYYVERPEQQRSGSSGPQSLDEHLAEVEKNARRITDSLKGLKLGISDAVITAARLHDVGKAQEHWQACMCVKEEDRPLAKTGGQARHRPLGGFRHEFASMVERGTKEEASKCEEPDLVLHLVAAHHGWARPHFNQSALMEDVGSVDDLQRTMIRYARLQRRFGPWGLAWLEGLLRGADWEASNAHAERRKNENAGSAKRKSSSTQDGRGRE